MTALVLALLLAQEPTATQIPDPADSVVFATDDESASRRVSRSVPTDSYADDATRELLSKARAYRGEAYLALREYSVRASSEISVGVRALLRKRTLFKCQSAVEVTWRRYAPSTLRVLGSRYAVPIAGVGPEVPEDLDDCLSVDLFQPDADRFSVFGDMVGGDGSDFSFRHPLARGSERHYRYALGDTTRISLPTGVTIRLVELIVEPRRNDADLLAGSLWVDADSHAVVQIFVRPARPADLDRDFAQYADPDDLDNVPGFLKPIEAEIRYIAVEYGLWEQRWWLPRLVAMEGVARVGRFARFPLNVSQRFGTYDVVGDTATLDSAKVAALTEMGDSLEDAYADSIEALKEGSHEDGIDFVMEGPCDGPRRFSRCFVAHLEVADSAELLTSDALPADMLSDEEPIISEGELEELGNRIARIAPPPWQAGQSRFAALWNGPELLRYNRVEGLSVGARAEADFGRLQLAGVARVGLAGFDPTVEVTLSRERYRSFAALSGYRRLTPVTRGDRSLGIGNSLNALLLGRDDGDYFFANGADLLLRPPEDVGGAWEVRFFAEAQRRARRETDFSLPNAFGEDDFRPNLSADRANQAGASVVLRHSSGEDPRRLRWGVEGFLEGSTGTFDFARPSVTLRGTAPLGRALVLGLEGAAGASVGDVPAQSSWLLGGPMSLRGYDGAAMRGDAFWRGRAELSNTFAAARVSLFTDVGWAGDRSEWESGTPLVSVGLGGSALDGLLRVDLARTLRSPIDWRLHLYLDGLL